MGSSKIQGRNGAKAMSGLIPAPSMVYILRNERQTKLAKKATSKKHYKRDNEARGFKLPIFHNFK